MIIQYAPRSLRLAGLLLACSVCSVPALPAAAVAHTAYGLTLPLASAGGAAVSVEVASASSFRLGVRFGSSGDAPAIASPSLDPARAPAPFTRVAWGGLEGVATSFGALLAAVDGSGAWVLYDAANATLVSGGSPSLNNESAAHEGGVVLPVNGSAAASGPGRPCLGNGLFGPPFYYNRDAGYLALAVSSWEYDPVPQYHHCHPVAFSGDVGRVVARDMCDPALRSNSTDAADPVRSASYPDGLSNTTLASCCAACTRAPDCIAYVWSDGSRPDPAGNCWPLSAYSGKTAAGGRVFAGAPAPAPQQAWWAMGPAADWYLAPAAAPLDFTRALYELTGAPALPPRHAFGFMVTYWGYEKMEFVEGNVSAFRDGRYPIDSTIMDYDWWNTGANKDLDFGYDPTMFGNHSFTHPPPSTLPNATTSGPAELFAYLLRDLGVRFGGIRKPRSYSNVPLSNASGWLLPNDFDVGAGDDNWNMTSPGWAAWYTSNHLHFLADGLDYWWNDEGETQWFTYLRWNMAQQDMYSSVRPNARHFTINRAFQPGMQRFPAVSWTGDRQDCSHVTVLTFTTAGQPYTACDMTSPNADVLVRQYWNAVFLPIMRVHAMHGTPRFPFLWGGEAHRAAFRKALETRYHFIPHLYSVAHELHRAGAPIALPASYNYPGDTPGFPRAAADATYMVGDALLPGDVSTANGFDPQVNVSRFNVPPGQWYDFNTTATHAGPALGLTRDIALDELVLLVRAGAILTLNRAVVQSTDALGGDLEVHVYAGADGAFTLVEDDGSTLDYARFNATRRCAPPLRGTTRRAA